MAHSATISRVGAFAVFCVATFAAAGTFAAGPSGSRALGRTAVPDELVVRARAGLRSHVCRRLFRALGARELGGIDALGARVIHVPRRRRATVEHALRRSGYFKSVEPNFRATAAEAPNDPMFAQQWGLAKLHVTTGWEITRGASSVSIAIVDSGVDAAHPDLRDQILSGYDFVNNDPDPDDDYGHGTRMAGIVGAATFNGLGVAGVAPGCKLIPVKVLDAHGLGTYSAIASGIIYAVDHGARIINLSLTGPENASILESAIEYATARGAVVVAAAGNDGSGAPVYPAAYPNVIAVAATTKRDRVARFSNSGSWLALAAPGVNVLTTSRLSSGEPTYAPSTGTSPAAAFVSGAVGLLFSASPALAASDAFAALTETTRDLKTRGWDPYSGWGRVDVFDALVATIPPSKVPKPIATTRRDRRRPKVRVTVPRRRAVVSGEIQVDVTASDNVGVTTVELLVDDVTVATDGAPPFRFLWDSTALAAGRHTLRARAYDAAGNQRKSRRVPVWVARQAGR